MLSAIGVRTKDFSHRLYYNVYNALRQIGSRFSGLGHFYEGKTALFLILGLVCYTTAEIEKSKDEEENDAENKNLKSNRTVKSLGFFIKCQTKSFTNLKSLKSKYKSKVKKKEFDYYSILREPIILFFVARDCEKIFFDIVDFRYRNSYNDFKNKINLRNLGDEKQQAWLYEVAKLYRFSVIEVVKNIHDTLENSLDTVEIDNMREFYTTELYNQANFYIAQCFPKLESDSLLKSAKHFNYGPLKYLSRRIESEFRFRLGNSVHGMR